MTGKTQDKLTDEERDATTTDEELSLYCSREEVVCARQLAKVQKGEQRIRELLWATHPCESKYSDDGELQCGCFLPPIDFKRESWEAIAQGIEKHTERRVKEFLKARQDVCLELIFDGNYHCGNCGKPFRIAQQAEYLKHQETCQGKRQDLDREKIAKWFWGGYKPIASNYNPTIEWEEAKKDRRTLGIKEAVITCYKNANQIIALFPKPVSPDREKIATIVFVTDWCRDDGCRRNDHWCRWCGLDGKCKINGKTISRLKRCPYDWNKALKKADKIIALIEKDE